MTWIKICGTTNCGDALAAVEAGADAVGFVFAPSPRQVDPETAREIAAALPPSVEKVGVFVDESVDAIRRTVQEVGLTVVQLQGEEGRDFVSEVAAVLPGISVFKALALSKILESYRQDDGLFVRIPSGLAGFVLDSGTAEQRGGTGHTFDWAMARASGFFSRLGTTAKVIVAGGLTCDNVGEAIRLFRPWGVDVCTGVEVSPGAKDKGKIRAFIAAVRDVQVS
jgi:phosphoribosylanthranilate isomerase